jgi:pimeloyl-ACP methyl ester carboxylesterase
MTNLAPMAQQIYSQAAMLAYRLSDAWPRAAPLDRGRRARNTPPSTGGNAMERKEVAGISLEIWEGGAGPPLLFLHPGEHFAQHRGFFDRLVQDWRVVVPRHPGFGQSARPDGFRTVHDLAYLYLDLIEAEGLDRVTLVGASFGGWIALEIAVRSLERIARLALIDAVGVKFGGREDRDIADIYALPFDELQRRSFHDPARAPDYRGASEEEMLEVARDREATALYAWRPYMHNPGLLRWLSRVRVPTLVLWGAEDGIVAPQYGEALARALPSARVESIEAAGHYPQIERPEAVAEALFRFRGSRQEP